MQVFRQLEIQRLLINSAKPGCFHLIAYLHLQTVPHLYEEQLRSKIIDPHQS